MSHLQYAGAAVLVLLAGGGIFWWTVQSPDTSPPAREPIDRLADSVDIRWTRDDTAIIEATTDEDALTALGYVHGIKRAWTVTVWRRTALGRMSERFGPGMVALDRHARRLGFARHARSAYDRLPAPTQDRLRAYTHGLNAALRSEQVRRRESFVFFGMAPETWSPWNVLAVERLLAWMGTSLSGTDKTSSDRLREFLAADRLLRRFLHLHGWDRSVAWATQPAPDTAKTSLFARHVLGTVADPIIQEVTVRRGGLPPVTVASLPGVPAFPTGTTTGRAWTYFLDSPAELEYIQTDSAQIRDWHERITSANGQEELVWVFRHGDALVLEPPASIRSGSREKGLRGNRLDTVRSVRDSSWVVRWPGFRSGSDVPHWLDTATLGSVTSSTERELPDFELLRGSGLTLDSLGTWTVRGQPTVVERTPRSILVGQASWARHQAGALRAQMASPPATPRELSRSDSSTWAAGLLPHFLPDLRPLTGAETVFDDALPYLRNWDYRYESASIGAVLFERWMHTYRNEIGRMPSDRRRAYFAGPRRRRAFEQAIDSLVSRYGTDVRRWRWERIARDRRHFLVWSADSLVSADLRPMSTTRFAALDRPGRGHASTLAGGPALVNPQPLGPPAMHWNGWTHAGTHNMSVQRLRFDPLAFFARSMLEDDRPSVTSVSKGKIQATTHLVPKAPRRADDPSP